MKNTHRIHIRFSKFEREIFFKYALCYAMETNNLDFENAELCKIIIWNFIGEEFKGKPCTFVRSKRIKESLIYQLKIEEQNEYYDAMNMQMEISEKEYNLLGVYRQWHILQTEECNVTLSTLVKRIIIKSIYDYFKLNGVERLSRENRMEKVKQVQNEVLNIMSNKK